MNYAKEVAEALLKIGAVRLSPKSPFTWTSGIKSPIYCDNRMLISHVSAYKSVVDGFVDLLKDERFDCVAGTATAGIPWAAFLAYELKLPMVYVRSTPKGHGAKKRIEGDLPSGKRVLVVEDLISTGGSVVSTVEALRDEAGAVVEKVVAIFSYDFEKARNALGEAKVEYETLTDINVLSSVAVDLNVITPEERDMVLRFAKSPEGWND